MPLPAPLINIELHSHDDEPESNLIEPATLTKYATYIIIAAGSAIILVLILTVCLCCYKKKVTDAPKKPANFEEVNQSKNLQMEDISQGSDIYLPDKKSGQSSHDSRKTSVDTVVRKLSRKSKLNLMLVTDQDEDKPTQLA